MHLSLSLSLYLSISLSLYLSISLSIYLSIYLSLSIHTYVYVYIYTYMYNTQQKEYGVFWFGGGTDITPSYLDTDDMKHFHGLHTMIWSIYLYRSLSLYLNLSLSLSIYIYIYIYMYYIGMFKHTGHGRHEALPRLSCSIICMGIWRPYFYQLYFQTHWCHCFKTTLTLTPLAIYLILNIKGFPEILQLVNL